MNRWIGIAFTLLYLVLAWLIGGLGSIHGPRLLPHFVLGYLILALLALWLLYFFVRRRQPRRRTLRFALGGFGIGLCLVGASAGSFGLLGEWEIFRAERRAVATQVFNMRDEPLLSEKGNPIGIRLRYAMRFPDSNYFWQTASAWPEKDLGVSIWAEAAMTGLKIDPPMRVVGAYGGAGPDAAVVRRYEAGTVYDFTVDLLPYFLIQSQEKTRLCIWLPPPEFAAAFDKLIKTDGDFRYKIRISGTKYEGLTEQWYSPKSFYESAIKEGAAKVSGAVSERSTSVCR